MRINFNDVHFKGLINIYGDSERVVSAIVYDSREVINNAAFFCIIGENVNGHQFINGAVNSGASVVIGSDKALLKEMAQKYNQKTFIEVTDTKIAMAQFAAIFYQKSYKNLSTIAVTGTNGKTTVTSYTQSLLNHTGLPTGSIGTLGIWDDEKELDYKHSTHTTPEPPDLHLAFNQFYHQHLKAAVTEVTSIAIEQKRVEGLIFDIGVHTNLTPEHLDFHPSFEAYKQAKLKLFRQVKKAVINIDDAGMAQDILSEFKGPVITYSLNGKADISAYNIKAGKKGTFFELHIKNHVFGIQAPVFGDFNISNLLASIGACLHLDISAVDVLKAIEYIQAPEGRFQFVNKGIDYHIITDYAHTQDGLGKVLDQVHKFNYNRLILMITGVGLRDPLIRPQMAQAAEGKADEIVVSVDHPGFFDRQIIVNDVLSGFTEPLASNIHVILHREKAVHAALSMARKQDIVLLTGLGFGGYQVVEGRRLPYAELEVIKEYFHNTTNNSPYSKY